jgi:adenylate cyclase
MESKRQLAAIMFTDIVGYTAMMSMDEALALALLRRNREIHKSTVTKYGGEWLKEMGDGTLLSFGTSTDAVRCAAALQNDFYRRSKQLRSKFQ